MATVNDDDPVSPERDEKFTEQDLKKAEKLGREAVRVMGRVVSGQTDSREDKVATILNRFPDTRENDITLAIRLYEEFYPDYISGGRIRLTDFHVLPRMYDMQRDRAHIQNSLLLFRAPLEVRKRRRARAEELTEYYAGSSEAVRFVNVFADESGKTDNFLIFGSFWLYRPSDYQHIGDALAEWRAATGNKSEFHFSKVRSEQHASAAFEFFSRAVDTSPFNAFIALAARNLNIPKSERSRTVYDGLAKLVVQGVKSELATDRLSAPVEITFYKDADVTSDFQMDDMKQRIRDELRSHFPNGDVTLQEAVPLQSHQDDLVQLSDLFTGAVNRHLNGDVEPTERGNAKDQLAARIGKRLEFFRTKKGEKRWYCRQDQARILYLDEL